MFFRTDRFSLHFSESVSMFPLLVVHIYMITVLECFIVIFALPYLSLHC